MTKEQSWMSLLTVVAAILTGDVAAFWLGNRRDKTDAKKARDALLRSLLSEVARIRSIAESHTAIEKEIESRKWVPGITRLPVATFESAASRAAGTLAATPELRTAISQYLASADAINILVDYYFASLVGPTGHTAQWALQAVINRQADYEINSKIDQLESCLNDALNT
jgi:hypothetical protein